MDDDKPKRGRPLKKDTQLSKETLRKRSQRRRKAEAKKTGKPLEVKKGGRPKKTITGTNQKPIKVQIEVTGASRGASRGRGRSASRGRVTPKVPPQVQAPAVVIQAPAPDTSTNLALMGMHREQQNTIAQTLQMQQEQIARGQEQFQELTGTTRDAMLQMGDAAKLRFERLETQMADIPERTTRMASNFILQSRGSRQDNLHQPFSEEPVFKPAFHKQVEKPEPLSLDEQMRQSSDADMKRTTSGLVNNDFNRTRQVGSEFNTLSRESSDIPSAFRNVRSNVQPILRASSDPIEDKRVEQDATAIGKSLKREQESGLQELSDIKQYLRLRKVSLSNTSKAIEDLLKQTSGPEVDVEVVPETPKQPDEPDQTLKPGPDEQKVYYRPKGSKTMKFKIVKKADLVEGQSIVDLSKLPYAPDFIPPPGYMPPGDMPPLEKSESVREAPPVKPSVPKPALDEALDEPIIREATESEQKQAAEETESESEEEPDLLFRGTDASKPFIGKLEKHLEELIDDSRGSQQKTLMLTLKVFKEKVKGKIPITLFTMKADKDHRQRMQDLGLSSTEFSNIQSVIKKNSELRSQLVKAFKRDNNARDQDDLDKLIAI